MKLTPILLALLVGTALGGLDVAEAVEIDPPRLEVIGKPGQPVTATLTLVNHQAQPILVHTHTNPYRYLFTAHTIPPTDVAAQPLPSCQSWITINHEELPLAAKTSGTLVLTITIPKTAAESPAGEYVASVLVDEQVERRAAAAPAGASTLTILPRIAIPVYVMLEGRNAPNGRIAAFTASGGRPGTPPTVVRLLLTLANDGRTHLRPTGTFLVTNAQQEVVYRGGVGRTGPIFPRFQEGIPVLIPLAAGRYRAVATVDLGGPTPAQRELAFTVTDHGQVEMAS